MTASPRDLDRLAKAVQARREDLHPSRFAAAQSVGISKDTWKRVEEGRPVRRSTYDKMDTALAWAPGSCIAVMRGGEPVLVQYKEAGGDPFMIAAVPQSILPEDVQSIVANSAMAVGVNVSVPELKALSDQIVEELRKRGILPSGD